MVFILILIDTVSCFVFFKNLVQSRSLDIGALPNNIFTIIESLFVLLLFLTQLSIKIQLIYQSFTGTCVENIHNASLYHLVKTNRVVSAVVKYFYYLRVHHHVSQDLSSQPKGLEVSFLVQVPNIDQKSILTVIKLNHLNKSSLSQITLQVYSQDIACQNMRGTFNQGFEAVDIVRFIRYEFFYVFLIEQQILFFVGMLKRTLARLKSELIEDMRVEFRVIDVLDGRKEQKQVVLEDQIRFYFIQDSTIVSFHSFAKMVVHIVPIYHSIRQFLLQVSESLLLNSLHRSLHYDLRSILFQNLRNKINKSHLSVLQNLIQRRNIISKLGDKQLFFNRVFLQLLIHFFHYLLVLLPVSSYNLLLRSLTKDHCLLVRVWRNYLCGFEVRTARHIADKSENLIKVHSFHENFVKSNTSKLPQQE